MRNKLLVIFGVLLLGSCASAPKSLSYREQLDVYKDMKIRLYKVAAPIKMAGVSVCPKTGVDNGVLTHRLSDYPQNMQSVAQSYWGLTNDVDAILYENISCNIFTCYTSLILEYDEIPNAYTDGENIFVTPALLDEIDDLSLALIIAHELAHIALEHAAQEPSETLEREADKFALFMLARAGLDYKKAALKDVASRKPHADGQASNTHKRAEYFRRVVAEIDTLRADGKALVP